MLDNYQGNSNLFKVFIKDESGSAVDPYIFSDVEVYVVHAMTQDIIARFRYVEGDGWGKLSVIEDGETGEEYLEFHLNDDQTAEVLPGLYQIQIKTVQPSALFDNDRDTKTYMANLMNINPAKTKYDADI